MNLKKKSEIQNIVNFKDMELFQPDEEENENSENEEPEEINDEEGDKANQIHRLNWVTSTNLYDSAIMVKEISAFY
jgi:predicted nucleic acid-binding protein